MRGTEAIPLHPKKEKKKKKGKTESQRKKL